MTPCRECGHQVANRAKMCPNCGVKKPTATKIEAGLDAFAAGAFKLGMVLCLLAVLVVACIAVVACSSGTVASAPVTPTSSITSTGSDLLGPFPPTTRPTTTKAYQRDEPATTRATTSTVAERPDYCTDYDTWTAADDEMDDLERRHGPDTSAWPTADVDALFAAMDRRAVAVQRVWARAPESATITSVGAACAE